MSIISMKQLLESGVHFGHQTRRWNPKMKEFIFTERNGIHIIDLQKTVKSIQKAYKFIKEVAANNGKILFVGTKKQAQEAVKAEALRCGMFFVNQRWLGGTLTNFGTISSRIDYLKSIERMEEDGTFKKYTKKEVSKMKKEQARLEKFLGGIKDMNGMPDLMFVIDPKREYIAIKEAKRIGIPVVGVVDTNCDPEEVDYPIPGNDDAIRAVKLLTQIIGNAVIEGKQGVALNETDELEGESDSANDNNEEMEA